MIPAVNELRYGGYHISNYIRNPEKSHELGRACSHCKRAVYDAYEASILFLLQELKVFEQDYRKVIIPEIVPNYFEYLHKRREIADFINSIDKETRDEHYEKCKKYTEELKTIVNELALARNELNKCIRKERKNSFIAIITVALTLLGVVVAIVAL